MEDEDFFIDNDDLTSDEQLDIIEATMLKLAETLEATSKELCLNLKLKEGSDAEASLSIISGIVSKLVNLQGINTDDLSDEEVEEVVEEALKCTTELTFNNINNVLSEDTPTDIKTTEVDNDDDSSLDF